METSICNSCNEHAVSDGMNLCLSCHKEKMYHLRKRQDRFLYEHTYLGNRWWYTIPVGVISAIVAFSFLLTPIGFIWAGLASIACGGLALRFPTFNSIAIVALGLLFMFS